MVVIHIQEVTSTQVTEITAKTLEDALFAYAENACSQWSAWDGATAEYYHRKSDAIKKMVFRFDDEQLTLYNVYGERFTAEWK